MRKTLPAPPQPSFVLPFDSASHAQKTDWKSANSQLAPTRIAPLDAAFLGRTARTTLWFGAFLTVCLGIVSRNILLTLSFAAGALLGLALLKSQQMLVARLAKPKEIGVAAGWLMRVPLTFLLPAKYLLVAVGIYFGLHWHLLVPAAFASGFTVLQLVIVSKVISRLMLHNQKPLHQYVSHEK